MRHISSKTHIHKEKIGIVVEEHEIIKLEVEEKDYILDMIIKGCRDNFFQTFEIGYVYGIKVKILQITKKLI